MKSAHGSGKQPHRRPYASLAWMAARSFVAMYVLMYAMVDRLDNVYSNLNQFYMAGLMVMPMVVIELVLMRSMIPHHAGAILMCEQTEMIDAAVLGLCREIISSQKSEIDQMKSLLSE